MGDTISNEKLIAIIQDRRARGEDVRGEMETLYTQNRGLIAKVASHYRDRHEMDDLMQIGYLALDQVSRDYSPDKGVKVSTMLANCVRFYICDYARDQSGLPSPMIDRISKIKRFSADYERDHGGAPSVEIVSYSLDLDPDQVQEALELSSRQEISTDTPVGNSEGDTDLTIEDSISDPVDRIEEVVEDLAQAQSVHEIWAAVDRLPETQARAVRLRYKENLEGAQIAEILGCSVGKVYSAMHRAFLRLRQMKVIRNAAVDYGMACDSYGGTLASFEHTGFSSVERAVMVREGIERNCRERLAMIEQS